MPGSAVFVDQTGQRHRRMGRWLKLVGLIPLLYVLMLFAALVRAPWVPRIALPGLGPVVPHVSAPPPSLGAGQVSTPLPTERPPSTPEVTSTPSTTAATSRPSTVASTTPATTRPTPSSTTPSTTPARGNGPPSSLPGQGATNPHRP